MERLDRKASLPVPVDVARQVTLGTLRLLPACGLWVMRIVFGYGGEDSCVENADETRLGSCATNNNDTQLCEPASVVLPPRSRAPRFSARKTRKKKGTVYGVCVSETMIGDCQERAAPTKNRTAQVQDRDKGKDSQRLFVPISSCPFLSLSAV